MTIKQKQYARKIFIIMALVLSGLLLLVGLFEDRLSFLSGGIGNAGIYLMYALFFLMFMQRTGSWDPSLFSMKKRDARPMLMGIVSSLLLAARDYKALDGLQSLDENILALMMLMLNALGIEMFFRVYGAYIFGGTDDMGVNDYIFTSAVYGVFMGVLGIIAKLGSGSPAVYLQSFGIACITGFFMGLMIMAVYARTDSLIAAVILNVFCNLGGLFALNSSSGSGLGILGTVFGFLGCLACLGTAASLIPGNVKHYSDHD